jgi:chloride channel 3/4/5
MLTVLNKGLLIGLNMAIISIATEWTSDLRQGYCSAGWWLNQKFCCEGLTDSSPGGGGPKTVPAAIVAQVATAASNASSIAVAMPVNTTLISNTTKTALGPAINAAARFGSRAGPMLSTAITDFYSRAAEAGTSTPGNAVDSCEDWVSWSSWTVPSYFIFILLSVAFAALCAHLVRIFAPYAAGSGISEIKCILAGFVINGFLGAWTFALKSLTLVSHCLLEIG